MCVFAYSNSRICLPWGGRAGCFLPHFRVVVFLHGVFLRSSASAIWCISLHEEMHLPGEMCPAPQRSNMLSFALHSATFAFRIKSMCRSSWLSRLVRRHATIFNLIGGRKDRLPGAQLARLRKSCIAQSLGVSMCALAHFCVDADPRVGFLCVSLFALSRSRSDGGISPLGFEPYGDSSEAPSCADRPRSPVVVLQREARLPSREGGQLSIGSIFRLRLRWPPLSRTAWR